MHHTSDKPCTNFALCWRRAAIAPHAATAAAKTTTQARAALRSCLPFYRLPFVCAQLQDGVADHQRKQPQWESDSRSGSGSVSDCVSAHVACWSCCCSWSWLRSLPLSFAYNLFSFFVLLTFPKMYVLSLLPLLFRLLCLFAWLAAATAVDCVCVRVCVCEWVSVRARLYARVHIALASPFSPPTFQLRCRCRCLRYAALLHSIAWLMLIICYSTVAALLLLCSLRCCCRISKKSTEKIEKHIFGRHAQTDGKRAIAGDFRLCRTVPSHK